MLCRKPLLIMCLALGLVFCAPLRADSAHTKEQKEAAGLTTFMVYFENDFFAGTDRHYTNAVKLTMLTKDIARYEEVLPAWSNLATKRLPFARQALDRETAVHNIGFSLGHNIYTPEDTDAEELIEDDRPYAGWLYAALALHRREARRLDTFEVTVGVVGPSAYGEEIQNTVHSYGGSNNADGWDHQLEDELGVMLSWQQSRKVLLLDGQGIGVDLIPHFGLTLGNVFTYANLGCEARLGWNLPWDFGTALIRPGSTLSAPIPGHGRRNDFGIHVFAGTDVRLVFQNIFLDGNTWKSSHSVDKKPFVADLYAGIGLSYKRFRIVYTHAYRTEEFDGQGRGQSFGSVNLRFAF